MRGRGCVCPCKMSHSVTFSFIKVLILAATVSWTGGAVFVPDSFTTKDLSAYTIRYLSMDGNDTEDCLSSPIYTEDHQPSVNSTVQYCRSLSYALTGGNSFLSRNMSNLIVLILPGVYSMGERGIVIINYQNIILSKKPNTSGEVIIMCVRHLEDNFNNFYVVNAVNFSLNDVVFTGCGSYSTSVRLHGSINAVISNCIFRNNTNCGFTASQTQQLVLTNCLFHDNNSSAFYNYTDTLDPGNFRFSGGLLISWNATENPNAQKSAIIQNCTFLRNHAVSNVRNSNDTRPDFYRPRGHGGAIVLAFDGVSDFTATIIDTKITRNTAISSGAGIFISFYDGSASNKVVIKNTTFEENMCNRDGGAISVNTFEVANDNALIVEDSNFNRNKAMVGGGACSVNIQDNLVPEEAELINNTATFSSCTFTGNSSPTGGSAISLVSNSHIDQTLATTDFINCIFTGNKAEREGAIMSFRFPISLNGTNTFRRNEGGGLSLMQSRVDVSGAVHFIENTAVVGGGMALEDQCLIHLLRESEMNFIGNSATMQGGAISVRAPSVAIDSNILPIFNTRCFIEYEITTEPFSLDPAFWEVTVRFINNTAGEDGAAIHATSIDRCTYTPSYNTSENATTEFEKSIFQLSPQFTFSGNHVLNQTIKRTNEIVATAPSQLVVEPKVASGMPGETISFKVTALDQAGNRQPAVWSITENNENQPDSQVDEFLSLPESGTEQDHFIKAVQENFNDNCSEGLVRHLDISLVQVIAGGVSSVSSATINVTCCHPGYVFNKDDGLCRIDGTNSIIDRPHPGGRYFYASSDLYVESRNGKLVSAVIPPTFQNCTREGIRPGCLFKFDLPYEQCSQNRTGFLCGRCPKGKGVDLTLRQCKECTVGDAVGVAIVYVAFFVASLLVLFFNIGIPNELKGCLFFIQVVGFVYESSNGISWDFHLSRFFGFNLYLPLCPYPGYNALGTVGYGVLLSLLSIATLVLYIVSARFSKVLSNRNSVEGIWLLSIITYKYTADTCFNLLRCQKVSSGEFVYYYNGSIQCFRSTHLAVSIIALLLGVTVVLLFPVIILVISYKTFKFTKPFTDVLIKDIKVSCRWWSGFDLIRRLLFITVVFFFNYVQPSYTQIALFFTGIFVCFIFAVFKPYQTRIANLIEALVLIDLLLLTSLFLNTSEQAQAAVRPLSQLLLLLPFISVTIYIMMRIIGLIWNKLDSDSFETFCKGMLNRYSRILKDVSTQKDLVKTETFEIENEDFRNEEDEGEKMTDYTAYREELLEY